MVSCPSCGTFNEAGNQFCGSCGRPLTIAPLQPPQVSHRRRNGLVVAVIIIVFLIAIVALLTVPVTHSFTGTVQSSYCSSCSSNPSKYVGFVSETIPSGSVSVQWQDASGDYVAFSVLQVGNFNTNQNCVEDGISGTCSFTSAGGTYTVGVQDLDTSQTIETVTFTVTYSAPYL